MKDVLLIEPDIYIDERGFFFESFNEKNFNDLLGYKVHFVQDNHSFSKKGVLRGLHFQDPYPQGKLVRVLDGEVFDVVVDIRKNSPTYAQWAGFNLNSKDNHLLWIPEGFAHGFQVISDTAHFLYKTNNYWNNKAEQSINWNDPTIKIKWPISNPILSDKDSAAPHLSSLNLSY